MMYENLELRMLCIPFVLHSKYRLQIYSIWINIDELCYKISDIHSNPVSMTTQRKSPIFDDFIQWKSSKTTFIFAFPYYYCYYITITIIMFISTTNNVNKNVSTEPLLSKWG